MFLLQDCRFLGAVLYHPVSNLSSSPRSTVRYSPKHINRPPGVSAGVLGPEFFKVFLSNLLAFLLCPFTVRVCHDYRPASDMRGPVKLVDDYPLEGISEADLVILSDSTSTHSGPGPEPPISNTKWPAFFYSSDRVAPATAAAAAAAAVATSPTEPLSALPLVSNTAAADEYEENIDWDEAVTLAASSADQDHEGSTTGLKDSIQGPLTPFVRPMFPDCASDKAQIPGVSPRMVLRTCFRIGEMISQTFKCHAQQQDVVFELYARVKQSERETLTRKQHFLLTDLFKDSPPYPRAHMTGWREGNQLDKNAAHFLELGGELELYWCLCRPNRDPRSIIGWTYNVLRIKPINWDYVEQARDILFQARGPVCSG